MVKSTSSKYPPSPRIKELIHKCGNIMYVIPAQDKPCVLEEIEAYMITFNKPPYYSSEAPCPQDIVASHHKFCPHCGTQLFIEITEGER